MMFLFLSFGPIFQIRDEEPAKFDVVHATKDGRKSHCIGVTLDNIRDFHALIFGGVLTISGRGVHQITPYIADEKTSVSLTVEDLGIEYKMTVKKVKLPPFDGDDLVKWIN